MSKTANSIGLRIGVPASGTSAPMRILLLMGPAVFLFAWFAGMPRMQGIGGEVSPAFAPVLLFSTGGTIPDTLNQPQIGFRQPSLS
jgi:hypothetical protein